MTYEEQIEASAAVQQWLSKIPGWSERLLVNPVGYRSKKAQNLILMTWQALKMDIMLLFGVKSGSQVYEDTVQVTVTPHPSLFGDGCERSGRVRSSIT